MAKKQSVIVVGGGLAGLAASLGIAVGLAAAGFAPAAAPISVAPASVVSGGEPARSAVEPEVVYIKPAPKRRSIVRTVTDRPQRSTDFIAARPDLLQADLAIVSDSDMHDDEGTPAITYGLRGIAYWEVKVSGPAQDVHSGSYGNGCENPANVLVRMLASLTDVYGRVTVPGDKSISHRYALLAALADGISTIENYSPGADCAATLECLRTLGVGIRQTAGAAFEIEGRGLGGLTAPTRALDAANSGTTMRLLAGVVASVCGDRSPAAAARKYARPSVAPLMVTTPE